MQCDLFIAYCSSFYGATLWNTCSTTFKEVCAAWRKCQRKIWRVHPMTHCDVIALLSHSKPMEIQQRSCKFVANIFQNGTPVLRTIVLTALNNPLSVFVATIIPSLVTVIWIIWKSGRTCTNTSSPRCLGGIWYTMLMPCVNNLACVMVPMFPFYSLMKREILLTTFVWIDTVRLFIMYHLVPYTLDIFVFFYLSQFTFSHCDSMCFYLFIYSCTYMILIYVFLLSHIYL